MNLTQHKNEGNYANSASRNQCAGRESALLIVLNHAGDVLAANIAMQAAEREGLNVKMVLTQEDISTPEGDRRGLVGCVAVYKVAGAAAEKGAPFDACFGVAQRMERNMRTLAVAVRTATHPATGQPTRRRRDGDRHRAAWRSGNRPHEAESGKRRPRTSCSRSCLQI